MGEKLPAYSVKIHNSFNFFLAMAVKCHDLNNFSFLYQKNFYAVNMVKVLLC